MKDFIGQNVVVGDYIFHSTTGRYPESLISQVSRMTDKSLFAIPVASNRVLYDSEVKEKIIKNTFIKVTELWERQF